MRAGTIPRHVADPAGCTMVVLRCMCSAVVAGLNGSVAPVKMQSTRLNAVVAKVKPPCFTLGFPFFASSAFLGGHHVDIARYKGHLLAPAFGALQFQRFVLGNGLGALKLLPALLTTILVGRHGLKPSKWRQR